MEPLEALCDVWASKDWPPDVHRWFEGVVVGFEGPEGRYHTPVRTVLYLHERSRDPAAKAVWVELQQKVRSIAGWDGIRGINMR